MIIPGIEVIELLYSLQEMELSSDAASEEKQKSIAELREKLPASILGHYDRLMRRGRKGVAIVTGANCPECHMTLPSGTKAQLMRGDDIVLCDTCARYLLYKKEETETTAVQPAKPRAPRTPKAPAAKEGAKKRTSKKKSE